MVKRIISRAPVRVCDIGGWTDTWFAGHGAVFHIAVTPFVEVRIDISKQETDKRVTLHLENYNETYSLDPRDITYSKHPLIEASIDIAGVPPGIALDVHISSEAPSGASIGTSAAVCVALIAALDALPPGRKTPREIAAKAHKVETEKLGLQSGIQDQLCSALGGINFIDMFSFPESRVIPVKTPDTFPRELQERMALIYIGTPHNSSDVHKMVIADLGKNASMDPRLEELRQLAVEARDAAAAGDFIALGAVMNRNTAVQRELHPGLVCEAFETVIDIASGFGVLGCKVNGAGGDGGSITILGDGNKTKLNDLILNLQEKGFYSVPITLSPGGVRVEEV